MIEIILEGVGTIEPNYIMSLSQKSKMFSENFKLGGTICREFDLEIDKNAISIPPIVDSEVIIKNDGVPYAQLYVDNVDDTNDRYYKLTLLDRMINLNANYDWSSLANKSVTGIIEAICEEFGLNGYIGSLPSFIVDWYEPMSARTFVGYVAELIGGYAYVDEDDFLVFKTFTSDAKQVVPYESCSTFKVSAYHHITRVVYDNGVATVIKGNESGDTLYLNADNILFTDNTSVTINSLVTDIYNAIFGFEFYNISVEKCEVDASVLCGDIVSINNLPVIAEIDWSYNLGWRGGYTLDLQTSKQEETQVVDSTTQKLKSLKIIVNREENEIKQLVTQVDTLEDETETLQTSVTQQAGQIASVVSDVTNLKDKTNTLESSIVQQTDQILMQVQELESDLIKQQTTFIVKSDGAYIQQGNEKNYSKFTDSGMQIYSNSNKIAEATSDTFKAPSFTTDHWTIREDNGVLCFYKGDFK